MIKFKKIPLIEVIAGFRWQVAFAPVILDSVKEDFISDFIDKIADKGFYKSERLTLKNVPVLPNQPVIKIDNKEKDCRINIGHGFLSIHATKPDVNWEWKNFKPYIKNILETFVDCAKEKKINEANYIDTMDLRYIDVFTPDFLDNIENADFISKILKINTDLPNIFQLQNSNIHIQQIQTIINMGDNTDIILALSENLNPLINNISIMMNTIYFVSKRIDFNINNILNILGNGNKKIIEAFVELTKPIHEKMGAYDE